jgi:hypothetical protein
MRIRCRVPNLQTLVPSRPSLPLRSFLALVTRTDPGHYTEAANQRTGSLEIGVVDILNGPDAVSIPTHYGNSIVSLNWEGGIAKVDVPVFQCAASIAYTDLTGRRHVSDIYDHPQMRLNGKLLRYELWHDGAFGMSLQSFAATPTGSNTADTPLGVNGFLRYTVISPGSLDAVKVRRGASLDDTDPFTEVPYTPGMPLTFQADETNVFYSVRLHWRGTIQQFDRGGAPVSSLSTNTMISAPLHINLVRR